MFSVHIISTCLRAVTLMYISLNALPGLRAGTCKELFILKAKSSGAQGLEEAHPAILPRTRPRNLLQRSWRRRHRSAVRQVQPSSRLTLLVRSAYSLDPLHFYSNVTSRQSNTTTLHIKLMDPHFWLFHSDIVFFIIKAKKRNTLVWLFAIYSSIQLNFISTFIVVVLLFCLALSAKF